MDELAAMDALTSTNTTPHEPAVTTQASIAERYVLPAGVLLILLSLALNVFLARRLHKLTNEPSALLASRATERLLKVGTTVPPITAKCLDGRPAVISYDGAEESTVLYIFTPRCSWCARNMDNLKTLLGTERCRYRFIGLSLSQETLLAYVAKNDLNLPVYSGLTPETLKTYKLGSTPQTIVISAEGKGLEDWAGAYVGDQNSKVQP